jgi:ADP-heptose:LPS heptosyltransferase
MLDKRWPPEHFAALARQLLAQGFQIVLTGSAGDAPLCAAFSELLTPAPHILAGQLSLSQFGALCEQASLFVGGDTGAMHLAVACGCKTVAIFGPSNPNRYAPFGPPDQVRTVWHRVALPEGGVGQGEVHNFSWTQGATVAEVWEASQTLLGL